MTARAYLFRRVAASADAFGFREIGLAVARDVPELFWILDEFGNPYEFEFCLARPGYALHTWQGEAPEADQYETTSEAITLHDGRRWRRIVDEYNGGE